jgi:hypothetical protein
MNRRKFLAAMAAGAVVTAEGLWIPGQKLISIPRPPKFFVGDVLSTNDFGRTWHLCRTNEAPGIIVTATSGGKVRSAVSAIQLMHREMLSRFPNSFVTIP